LVGERLVPFILQGNSLFLCRGHDGSKEFFFCKKLEPVSCRVLPIRGIYDGYAESTCSEGIDNEHAGRVEVLGTGECRKVKVEMYNYSAAYGDPKGIVRQRTWG
jgi:hypothetical protein